MWCSPAGALPQYGFAERCRSMQPGTAPHISRLRRQLLPREKPLRGKAFSLRRRCRFSGGCGVAPQGRCRSTDSPQGVGQCNLVPHPTSVSKADSGIVVQLPLAIVYFESLRGAPLPREKPFGANLEHFWFCLQMFGFYGINNIYNTILLGEVRICWIYCGLILATQSLNG